MGSVIDQARRAVELLGQPPIPLAAAWVAWLAFAIVLIVWYRRAQADAAAMEESFSRPSPRSRSGVRPPKPQPDAFEELQTLLDGDSTVQS